MSTPKRNIEQQQQFNLQKAAGPSNASTVPTSHSMRDVSKSSSSESLDSGSRDIPLSADDINSTPLSTVASNEDQLSDPVCPLGTKPST